MAVKDNSTGANPTACRICTWGLGVCPDPAVCAVDQVCVYRCQSRQHAHPPARGDLSSFMLRLTLLVIFGAMLWVWGWVVGHDGALSIPCSHQHAVAMGPPQFAQAR